MAKYVNILIKRNVMNLDRLFTYSVPEEYQQVIRPGMRVIVDFNKTLEVSLVVECMEETDSNYKIKPILDLVDTKAIVNDDLIKLGLWMKQYYILTYAKAFEPILGSWNISDIKYVYEVTELEFESDDEIITKVYDSIVNDLKINESELSKTEVKRAIFWLEENAYIKSKAVYNLNKKYKTMIETLDFELEEIISQLRANAKSQINAIEFLYANGGNGLFHYEEIRDRENINIGTLKTLQSKGYLRLYLEEEKRTVVDEVNDYSKIELNFQQRHIYDSILRSDEKYHLLHGITGSGKTEIYLQLTEENLAKGGDTIILVPEIGLTPQMIERFYGRFGDTVAIIHSGLNKGERQDEMNRIRSGDAKIVIGARSAAFAPFENLKLIIVDEEHENTYKSNQNNKYDVRDVVEKRVADIDGAKVIFGSATPSIETYYRAMNDKYVLHELNERATESKLPEIRLIDMREELQIGNTSIFSYDLMAHMKTALLEDEQIILFLNRRGFSTFVSCRSCGYVVKCDKCDIAMVYHKHSNTMQCHYCGKTVGAYTTCPQCGSRYIKYFGAGTQQVEEQARKLFQDFKVARMDSDTTRKKGSHKEIFEGMKSGEIDILIGTQMIAKGLDFKNITVVGVVAADLSLNMPSLYASEETFQLVTQVAGRAGRGDKEGLVLVQTYNPDHYSLQFAQHHDYKGFYNEEIKIRRQFLYPPFTRLFSILLTNRDEGKLQEISEAVFQAIRKGVGRAGIENYVNFNGAPHPDSITKIKDEYRYRISITSIIKYEKVLKDILYGVCIDNSENIDFKNGFIDINFR